MAKEFNDAYRANAAVFLRGKALEVKIPNGLEYVDLNQKPASSPVDDALNAWQPPEQKEESDDDMDYEAADRAADEARARHAATVFEDETHQKRWRSNVVSAQRPVFYADIDPQAQSPRNYAVTFEPEEREGSIRCYFLPWRQNQITHMALGNDADFFFTATLDGCSVYVVGAESSPVVYHANAKGAPDPARQSDYMGRLVTLAFFNGMIPRPVALQKKNVVPALSKQIYHANAADFRPGVESEDPTAPYFNTGANVFGFREEGRWSFYYQQFVTGTCHPEDPNVQPLLQRGRLYYTQAVSPTRIYVGIMLKEFEPLWPRGLARVNA